MSTIRNEEWFANHPLRIITNSEELQIIYDSLSEESYDCLNLVRTRLQVAGYGVNKWTVEDNRFWVGHIVAKVYAGCEVLDIFKETLKILTEESIDAISI